MAFFFIILFFHITFFQNLKATTFKGTRKNAPVQINYRLHGKHLHGIRVTIKSVSLLEKMAAL